MIAELVEKIEAYTTGRMSRAAFETWFYELSFDAEEKHSGHLADVVHEVEGLLAESSSGGWSEADLRSELQAVVNPLRATMVA